MHRILVIDDEIAVCDLLKDFLTLKGYEVYTVSDGYTAINKVKEVCPHLVLLDIVMPGISGIKVLKEIKKLNPKTGVIMITAVVDQGIITESIDLGAYDYIRKPMDLKHVENVVIITINNMKNCTRSCHSEQKGRAISVRYAFTGAAYVRDQGDQL